MDEAMNTPVEETETEAEEKAGESKSEKFKRLATGRTKRLLLCKYCR